MLLLLLPGCGGSPSTSGVNPAPPRTATPSNAATISTPPPAVAIVASAPPKKGNGPAQGPFRFEALGASSGIAFVQTSGMNADHHYPTANGSGVAILDYDRDGKLDLYFASGNLLPIGPQPVASNRLYRNLGDGKFLDVTEGAGVGFRGFCHGIIAGDLDNDGDTDLILCNYGANVLYLNNGDGTFRDVSREAGIGVPNWSSGGALLDFDNDGDLDVYIANYGKWDINVEGKVWCGDNDKKIRRYCSPRTITPAAHLFYRNEGLKDGIPRFIECSKSVGLSRTDGRGFGVVSSDLNGDGKIDLYVANDQCSSFVYYNNGDGTFRDESAASGAAFDVNGNLQSGMGVDACDYDGDGLVDFDNDGWPDLFVTNGHVDDNLHLLGIANQPHRELPTIMKNQKGLKFTPASPGAGPYFEEGHVGRGVAFGDLDDDGRPDIAVNHKDDAPGVLLNRTTSSGHWIRLTLKGTKSNRDAIGAKVEITADGRTIHRQKNGGGSLESTNEPRLLIGVGEAKSVKVVIHWPSGLPDTIIDNAEVDRTLNVTESEGVTGKTSQ